MSTIRIKSFENGGSRYELQKYRDAANEFRRSYKVDSHPAVNAPDSTALLALYYAAMSSTYSGNETHDKADFEAAIADFDKLLAKGYEAEGDVYRLKFIDLYNLDRKPESLATLQEGISRFPGNEDLIDVMMRYYAENDGDPTSMIPLVEAAIAKSPDNPMLYQGLARVYDKLEQIDNSIETMKKAVTLAPDDFFSNYYLGLFIVKKGDAMNVELGQQTFTSRTESQAARERMMDVFRSSVAPLEKAHALNPEEDAAVELLKNVTFWLRDDEGMMQKYEKYNTLFKSMSGAE
jgi:tetratricopeptide (TPR) repeat protein